LSVDPPRTVRVLYVEDAIDQALLVKTFFSALKGFTVSHAQDGDTALKHIANKPWDLLVTDLNLPGADGFALIKAFRAKFRRSPVLVTTGYTQAEYEEQALRAGADQVMIKPLNQAEFISRVQAMAAAGQAPEEDDSSVVLAIEGRLGDAEMGCGGTLMTEVAKGHTVVLVPICRTEEDATPEELKAASLAASILGVELRVDRTLFGNRKGQLDLIERTLNELRPTAVYIPAKDDRDPSRRDAALVAEEATAEVRTVLAYETATTGLEFTPSRFHDIRAEMVMKMEALAAYQALGAPRVDLRPRMAQAYARYWGRFKDFAEVEAFEQVRGDADGDGR
jgi:CheY-like chemotaxis protein